MEAKIRIKLRMPPKTERKNRMDRGQYKEPGAQAAIEEAFKTALNRMEVTVNPEATAQELVEQDWAQIKEALLEAEEKVIKPKEKTTKSEWLSEATWAAIKAKEEGYQRYEEQKAGYDRRYLQAAFGMWKAEARAWMEYRRADPAVDQHYEEAHEAARAQIIEAGFTWTAHEEQYRALKRRAKRLCRMDQSGMWEKRVAKLVELEAGGEWKEVWRLIRVWLFPNGRHMATIKDETGNTLTDIKEIIERWNRHGHKIYNVQGEVDAGALLRRLEDLFDRPDERGRRPRKLDRDEKTYMADMPNTSEVKAEIEKLKFGKASGATGVTAELIRAAGEAAVQELTSLVQLIWDQGHLPKDFVQANVVWLYKQRGDMGECNSYRGASHCAK